MQLFGKLKIKLLYKNAWNRQLHLILNNVSCKECLESQTCSLSRESQNIVRPHCCKNSQFGLSWEENGSFWLHRCIRINHVLFRHIYHISKCHSFIVDLCGQKSLPLGSERAAVSFVVTELEQLGSSDSCPYLVKSPDPLYGTYRCNVAPLHNLSSKMRKPALPNI